MAVTLGVLRGARLLQQLLLLLEVLLLLLHVVLVQLLLVDLLLLHQLLDCGLGRRIALVPGMRGLRLRLRLGLRVQLMHLLWSAGVGRRLLGLGRELRQRVAHLKLRGVRHLLLVLWLLEMLLLLLLLLLLLVLKEVLVCSGLLESL